MIRQIATLILMIGVSCTLGDSLVSLLESGCLLAWERYHGDGNMPENARNSGDGADARATALTGVLPDRTGIHLSIRCLWRQKSVAGVPHFCYVA